MHLNIIMKRHLPLIIIIGSVVAVSAQDAMQTLQPLTVTGGEEAVLMSVGSAAFVTEDEIRRASYTNINQILAKVPGAYVRDEDGFGNFPNISLRGGDGTRTAKVTVMEDGILTAPATYSAPAAYYFPRVSRMSGVEVMKGSSQVRYGPLTTGGVLNFLSTPIPEAQRFYSKTTYGSHNTFFNLIQYGDSIETDVGRVGYLFESLYNISDGFRKIDGSSQDTGFTLFEPMLKLSFEPNTALKQKFEFKIGHTDFDADETYVGLTDADLRANPDRRYAGSVADNITTDQTRTYLKWMAELTPDVRVESALYYNKFSRDWFKADRVGQTGGPLRNIHEVLAPGSAFGTEFGVLRGDIAGDVRVKGNARDYEAFGWQNQVNRAFETGTFEHDLAVGLRIHRDEMARNQYTTTYLGDGAGNFTPDPTRTRVFIPSENDINRTTATAIYLEDTIRTGALTLKPGIRYEYLDLEFRDRNNAANNLDGSNNLWSGGMGATWEFDESRSLFGGIYRGVSLPGVRAAIRDGVDEERSISYELGYRHRGHNWSAEIAGFFTDFSNIISVDTGVGGINNQNAGAAEVWGIESLVQYDPMISTGSEFSLPMYLSATWTRADFKGTTAALAGGGDGMFAGGRDGNAIPYTPEWKIATGIGASYGDYALNVDAYYTSSTWGTGYNGDPRPGTPTIRDGKIPALFLVDLTGSYQVNDNIRLLAGVHNLFDQRKLTSRIPEGPRANAPRMIFAGIEAEF